MTIIINGSRRDMDYPAICRMLGDYVPAIQYVKITRAGKVSCWAGKPEEARQLLADVRRTGCKPAADLIKAARC